MNRKELTKDIYGDFILKKPFGFHGLYKNNSALEGLTIKVPFSSIAIFNCPSKTRQFEGEMMITFSRSAYVLNRNSTHVSNFYTLEFLGRVSETQLQVGKNLNSITSEI